MKHSVSVKNCQSRYSPTTGMTESVTEFFSLFLVKDRQRGDRNTLPINQSDLDGGHLNRSCVMFRGYQMKVVGLKDQKDATELYRKGILDH